MRSTLNLAAILALGLLFLAGCGTNTNITNPVDPPDDSTNVVLTFGTPESFDLVTWNLETFPLNNPATSELLAQIVPLMKVDVIAFQEIMNYYDFMALAELIPHYAACVSGLPSDGYRLAYLYDTRTVQVNDQYMIHTNQSNPFPRPPYVLDLTFQGRDIVVIDNHLKAMGDNYIDETDDWDEEVRRRLACQMLDEYITDNLADRRVFVVGDMNDQIAEGPETNVFTAFLDKPEEYLFADMPIAQNPTYSTVSYPSYVSHLDHILLSNELFTPFADPRTVCRVIKVEDWMGSWQNYSNQLSDHRPVGLRLYFQ